MMTVCNSASLYRTTVFSAVALLMLAARVAVISAANDELHQLGLGHVDIIGTRFIDEHHDVHDYPASDKSDDHKSDESDYHNPIYDHVHVHKDDYSNFGGHKSHDSHDDSHDDSHEDSHKDSHDDSHEDSHKDSHEDSHKYSHDKSHDHSSHS